MDYVRDNCLKTKIRPRDEEFARGFPRACKSLEWQLLVGFNTETVMTALNGLSGQEERARTRITLPLCLMVFRISNVRHR